MCLFLQVIIALSSNVDLSEILGLGVREKYDNCFSLRLENGASEAHFFF